MRIKFQADADLDGRILRGLRRVAPEVDVRTAAEAGLAALEDPDVLRLAAEAGRILISQDRSTMPAHFQRFVSRSQSPGVILLRAVFLSQRQSKNCFSFMRLAKLRSGSTDWPGFLYEATRHVGGVYDIQHRTQGAALWFDLVHGALGN